MPARVMDKRSPKGCTHPLYRSERERESEKVGGRESKKEREGERKRECEKEGERVACMRISLFLFLSDQ
jgi:hypothetical protein